jgi:predicted transcriptional regulator
MVPVRRLLEKLEKEEKVSYTDLEPVTVADVENSLERTKSSVHKHMQAYEKWKLDFGSL